MRGRLGLLSQVAKVSRCTSETRGPESPRGGANRRALIRRLLGDDGRAGELAAVDARDRVLLGEERDAHGTRSGRGAVDDRARDVVVARPEDVEVGARVEVVVLAVEGARVVRGSDVQPC